jgi:hypothetical protein
LVIAVCSTVLSWRSLGGETGEGDITGEEEADEEPSSDEGEGEGEEQD